MDLDQSKSEPRIRKAARLVHKPLRHPLAFFLIPLCAINWAILIATHAPSRPASFYSNDSKLCPPFELVEYDMTLPLFREFHNLYRDRPSKRHIQAFQTSGGGIANPGPAYVVRADSKLILLPRQDAWDQGAPVFRRNIDSAALVTGTRRVEVFGLITPCATRYSTRLETQSIPGYSTLKADDLSGVVHSSQHAGSLFLVNGTQTHWELHPLAILHDAAFLFLFIAWLVSLSALPSWELWKRLESSTRGTDRSRCLSCGYPTTGLTSPTCPECGNTLHTTNPTAN